MSPASLSPQPLRFIFLHILFPTNYLCPESLGNGGDVPAAPRIRRVLSEASQSAGKSAATDTYHSNLKAAINMRKEIMGSKTGMWQFDFTRSKTQSGDCPADMLETLAKKLSK